MGLARQNECCDVRSQKWSDKLEQKALEYLDPKVMVISGEKTYPKNNTDRLGTKLFKAFSSTIWRRRGEVAALNDASQYGCNIVPQTILEEELVLRYACIYIKN
ncbi:hypothetical protein V3C99_016243 [Haemonchus contortus]